VLWPHTVAGYRAAVRLEFLSVFRWIYEKDVHVKGGYTILSAYGSEEGIAYSEGREPRPGGLRAPLSGRTTHGGARMVARCRTFAA
jgi:hypothetical protein